MIDETTMTSFRLLVEERLGLHFPPEREADLRHRLESAAAAATPPAEPAAFVQTLVASPQDQTAMELLTSHLTVDETHFFRDPGLFGRLEDTVIPTLLEARSGTRRLRIWSAGCCTGEEPYSLAILLDRMLAGRGDWTVTILATDLNPRSLEKARLGLYTHWSFRGTPAWVREGYFTTTPEGRLALAPRIRERVTFALHNLSQDGYPSPLTNTTGLDLILCRNVLMYFQPALALAVVGRFRDCLVPDGRLVLAPCEAPPGMATLFTPVPMAAAVIWRRNDGSRPDEPPRPRPLVSAPLAPPPPRTRPSAPPAPARPLPPPPPSVATMASPLTQALKEANDFARQGDLDGALRAVEAAMAADRLSASARLLHAAILTELGQAPEAETALEQALYLDPGLAVAHFLLGNARLCSGRRDQARRNLRNAAELASTLPPETPLPEGEGLTAGRLVQLAGELLDAGGPA